MIVTFRGGSFSFALGIYPPHVPYATAQGEESACRLKEDEEWNKEDKIGEKKEELNRITRATLDISLKPGPELDPPSPLTLRLCTWDQLKHKRYTYEV